MLRYTVKGCRLEHAHRTVVCTKSLIYTVSIDMESSETKRSGMKCLLCIPLLTRCILCMYLRLLYRSF